MIHKHNTVRVKQHAKLVLFNMHEDDFMHTLISDPVTGPVWLKGWVEV